MSSKILLDAIGTAAARRLVRSGASRIALLALVVALAGCSSADIYPPVPQNVDSSVDPNSPALLQAQALQRAIAAENKDDVYRIGKNDVLDIKVFNHPELNVSERVGGDGKISFPPLGDVTAAGLSERELQQQIQKSLRDGYINEAQVTAVVSEIKAASVGAIGAVQSTGQYSSFTPMHLADLILKAGGLAPGAGETATITRIGPDGQTSSIIPIDLDGLLKRGEQKWNILMQPGDILNVSSSGFIHVTGAGVEKPGTYPLAGKDLMQLLDDAGGLKFEGSNTIHVVRLESDGQRKVFDANYNQLLSEKTTDIHLRDGDRILVERSLPRTALSLLGAAFKNTFRFVVGGSVDLFSSNSSSNNSNRITSTN